jgi:hypothetical protein
LRRLKSDFRYSKDIVYDNFPWPEDITDKKRDLVVVAAKNVLEIRSEFAGSSLVSLYDPNGMPPSLINAHQALDKAVDLAYRTKGFNIEGERLECLFELFDRFNADLFTKEKVRSRNKVAKKIEVSE